MFLAIKRHQFLVKNIFLSVQYSYSAWKDDFSAVSSTFWLQIDLHLSFFCKADPPIALVTRRQIFSPRGKNQRFATGWQSLPILIPSKVLSRLAFSSTITQLIRLMIRVCIMTRTAAILYKYQIFLIAPSEFVSDARSRAIRRAIRKWVGINIKGL